jgi:integrase
VRVDAVTYANWAGPYTTLLKHWKFLIATIFAAAKSKGWLRGGSFDGAINPVQGAKIPRSAKSPVKLKPTSLEGVLDIIDALEKHPKAQAAVALCYFAGLRPGEARGIKWEYIEVVPIFDDNRQQVLEKSGNYGR